MSNKKERHIYTIEDGPNKKHAYIFNITRDTENEEISIDTIWLVVQMAGAESKILINLENVAKDIWANPNRQPTPELNEFIEEAFAELIEKNEQADEVKDLLKAAERAAKQYPIDFESQLKNLNEPRDKQ